VTWSGAADDPAGSGLAGYAVLFDLASGSDPGTGVDVPEAAPHQAAATDLASSSHDVGVASNDPMFEVSWSPAELSARNLTAVMAAGPGRARGSAGLPRDRVFAIGAGRARRPFASAGGGGLAEGAMRASVGLQGDLVEEIYAAALEPARWPGVLVAIAGAVNSPGAVLQVQSRATGAVLFAAAGGIEEAALDEYTRRWAAQDPRLAVGLPGRVGETLSAEEHLDLAGFRRSAIYNEFLAPLELGATLGAIVHADREIFVAAAAQRALRPPGFDAEEKRSFAALVPHLARATKIGHELGAAAAARRSFCATLDYLPRGVLLVDARLGLRYANRYAEEVLAAEDGLRVERGALAASAPEATAALRRLVAGAADPAACGPSSAGGYLALPRPSLRRALELLVAPLTPELAPIATGRAVAALFLVDPERRLDLPLEALRQLYGLTPAEARLAALVGEGLGLPEVAARLGIARETAKSNLRAVFAKTGTRRQSELVRLLLGGPGVCAGHRLHPRTGDAK